MRLNQQSAAVQGAFALAVGLLTGLLTVLGQMVLPGSLNSLANSGAVWLIPAFFVAASAGKKLPAILLCAATLLACVLSYYWFESLINRHPFDFSSRYLWIWLGCAAVAGVIFGFGAYLRGRKSAHYPWGTSLLPAVFLAEGLSEVIHLPDYRHMIPAVVGRILIGLALYFVLYKRDSLKREPLASFLALSALGLAGYELLLRVIA